MIVAILATGPSMSQAVADSVRDIPTIVVNDAFRLRPDALALVAQDAAWWKHNKDAHEFKGRKFTTNRIAGVEQVTNAGEISTGSSSGVLAIHIAKILGATHILLFGFDMQGTHYFGEHPAPLRNTTEQRFKHFQSQFAWVARKKGARIYNCTPGSHLEAFPKMPLEEALAECAHG